MRVHIVQRGDTLWKIAKQYAIGFDELKRLNAHLANPDYIVPGMEIYVPEMQKEKEVVKERPMQQPVPMPAEQTEPMRQPMWQGDLYVQPQMPAQQLPMQMPSWQQTHVHVEPTFEQTMMMPQMPMQPQMMPMQPQMMPVQPMFMPMPQMMPQMPICMCCHGVRMDEQTMTSPIQREESSEGKCAEQDARVQQYYEEIQQITQQPGRCCKPPVHPQMMPMPHVMPMHPMMMPWHM